MNAGARARLMPWILLAAACSDAAPSAADEVAGELRALRLALAAGDARPRESVDVQAALQPLRGALEALSVSQRDLAARQIALAQELQRWSQLLSESVAGARADEAKAMATKLQELERQLQAQDARHHEVETLIQGALERTADRLDDFLKRLHAPARTTVPPVGNDGAPAPAPAAANGGDERQAAADGSARRGGLVASRWWWLALTGVGAFTALFFLRRTPRPPRAELPPSEAPAVAAATSSAPVADAAPGEQSAEEIWAAAALLGEAVGRLRQRATVATGAPSATAEPASPDDLFCVAEPVAPCAPAVAPPAPPVAGQRETPPVPETIATVLAGGVDEDAVRAALAAERLVLRRPAPSVRADGGGVAVRFHVAPGASAAERVRLLQRLREATRSSR